MKQNMGESWGIYLTSLLDTLESESERASRSVMSDSLRLHSPWNSPGQNTGVGSLSLLQGIFQTQRWKPGLLHWQADSFTIEPPGVPKIRHSVQFSSVAQSCPTLHDPMNRSTPGLPVYHQLPEFTQTHVHRVRDAIQPSHPRSSPSRPALNPSQHPSLFQ